MRNSCILTTSLAIIAVAMMLSMPITVGYAATGYSAVTVNTGNSVSSSYFTVGLYTCTNESTNTYVSTNNLLKSSMDLELKRIGTDTYQAFGAPVVSANMLFLQVTENPSGSYTYTADAEGSTVTYTDNTGTHEVQGVTFSVSVSERKTEGADIYYDPVTTFDSSQKYRVNIIVSFSSQSIVPGTNVGGEIQCDLTFNISLSVHRVISNGVFAQGSEYTATLNEHTESQSVIEGNGNGVVPGDDSHTYYLTDVTNKYEDEGFQAVNISNEGNPGIMSRGNANVSIVMPLGTKFIIHFDASGGAPKNKLAIKIYNADQSGHKTGNPIYSTTGDGLSVNKSVYVYRQNSNITTGNSAPASDSGWFVVSSQYGVVIEFTSKNGNNPSADKAVVDIVMKPSLP